MAIAAADINVPEYMKLVGLPEGTSVLDKDFDTKNKEFITSIQKNINALSKTFGLTTPHPVDGIWKPKDSEMVAEFLDALTTTDTKMTTHKNYAATVAAVGAIEKRLKAAMDFNDNRADLAVIQLNKTKPKDVEPPKEEKDKKVEKIEKPKGPTPEELQRLAAEELLRERIRNNALAILGVKSARGDKNEDIALVSAIEKRVQKLFQEPWVKGGVPLNDGLLSFDNDDGAGRQYIRLKGSAEHFKLGALEGDKDGAEQNLALYAKLSLMHEELEGRYHRAMFEFAKSEIYFESDEQEKNEKDLEATKGRQKSLINFLSDDEQTNLIKALRVSPTFDKFKDTSAYKGANKNGNRSDELATLWALEQNHRSIQKRVIDEPNFEKMHGTTSKEWESAIEQSKSLLDMVGLYAGKLPGSNKNYDAQDPYEPWNEKQLNDRFFSHDVYSALKAPVLIQKADKSRGHEEQWEVRVNEELVFSGTDGDRYLTKEDIQNEALIRFVQYAQRAGVANIISDCDAQYTAGKPKAGDGVFWDGEKLYDTSNITQAMLGEYKNEAGVPVYFNPHYDDLQIVIDALGQPKPSDKNPAEGFIRGSKASAEIFGSLTDEQVFRLGQRYKYFDRSADTTLAGEMAKNPGAVKEILADIKDRMDGFHMFILGARDVNNPYNFRAQYNGRRVREFASQMTEARDPAPKIEACKDKLNEFEENGNGITGVISVSPDALKLQEKVISVSPGL